MTSGMTSKQSRQNRNETLEGMETRLNQPLTVRCQPVRIEMKPWKGWKRNRSVYIADYRPDVRIEMKPWKGWKPIRFHFIGSCMCSSE